MQTTQYSNLGVSFTGSAKRSSRFLGNYPSPSHGLLRARKCPRTLFSSGTFGRQNCAPSALCEFPQYLKILRGQCKFCEYVEFSASTTLDVLRRHYLSDAACVSAACIHEARCVHPNQQGFSHGGRLRFFLFLISPPPLPIKITHARRRISEQPRSTTIYVCTCES